MSIGKILGAAAIAGVGIAGSKLAERVVDKTLDTAGTSLSNAIRAINQQWQSGAGQTYVTATKSIRVEPFTLVDTRVARLPYAKDVAVVAQRLFSCYYLLSIAAENTIAGVKVARYLDKFAPDRDLTAATQQFVTDQGIGSLSKESYQFGLPFVGEAAGLHRYSSYCSESAVPSFENDSAAFAKGATSTVVQDVNNLAVGQIVDVTITHGDKKATVPVQIRLRTIGMDPLVMKEVLALGGEDQSHSARLRRFRVGELTLWRDLLLNQDQINRYRRAVMADKSGYFRKAYERANKGLFATMLTGQPSIGEASSIAIVSKDTIRDVEEQINGRFDDFYTRQGIFEQGLMMLILVVDEDHETISIYTRDIDDVAVHTIKDLKGVSGPANNDLSDIMRSFLEGKIPGRL